MKITPKIADTWLAKNTHNRTLRERKVVTLAAAMTRGEWVVNGEAIKWSNPDLTDGEEVLLDGQHRLWAVSTSGVTIESVVAYDVDPNAQETMDMGARRSLADALKLRGEVNTPALAATINLLHRWRVQTSSEIGLRNRPVPTIQQAIAYLYEDHDGIVESVRFGTNFVHNFPVNLPASVICSSHYVLTSIDEDGEDAELFFDKFRYGTELKSSSPIYALRRTLTASRVEYDSYKIHALIIKAWNAFREGKDVAMLTFKAGGAQPEEFPEPQ